MRRVIAAVALLSAACTPSASQIILYVDTDAPVPPSPGALPDPNRPPALFDRLRLEVLRDGAAIDSNTRRDFSVDEGMFSSRAVSIGIVPPAFASNYSVRARLYRFSALVTDEPNPSSTLDATIPLPPLDGSSVQRVMLHLNTEEVGQSLTKTSEGAPNGSSSVGSWTGAQIVPCAGAPNDDEACVPGGAFWIGDPHLGLVVGQAIIAERLTVVSPYFIDLHEVTVAQLRASIPAMIKAAPPGQDVYLPLKHDTDVTTANAWCNWTTQPDAFESFPVNCIDWATAQLYCQTKGGDLPSEAQFEYVASGRGLEDDYVWGHDEPSCDDAIWGRGGGGGDDSWVHSYPSDCRDPASIGGALVSSSTRRDRIVLSTSGGDPRVIVDLAGNLAEFARDAWNRADEPFWMQNGVLIDPVATQPSQEDPGFSHPSRGGGWYSFALALRAAYRDGVVTDSVSEAVGFRCIRTAR